MMRGILFACLLLACLSGSVFAEDALDAANAIKRIGGAVRSTDEGLEVDFHLRGRTLTDSGLKHVAVLKDLASLNLSRTQITSSGLAQLKGLDNLRWLHLEKTNIGDEAAEHLVALKNLEYLNLYKTKITDKALDQLASLKNLRRLYVWQTDVTDAGVSRLATALPELKIVRGVDLSKLAATFPKEEEKPKPKLTLDWVAVSSRAEAPPRSANGINCSILFENKSKKTVKLYWIAYGNGALKLYGTIAPGATRQQNSYSRNVWLVTNENDEPLGYFVVKEDDSVAVIPG